MSELRGDVRLKLNDLEAEEARIMRELREMDEKANAETEANRRRAQQYRDDPNAALVSLLMECEKEVRDAKGYIADEGPPLRIVRLRHGETGPKSATYLSRPRNTGVDFTVPVTLKAYTDIIKNPIFLNDVRDKIKAQRYHSAEDYLADMRLLVQNTAEFNTGADLAWVVQHAKFLLEAAEDAVTSRRHLLHDVEDALRSRASSAKPGRPPTGKRKRAQAHDKSNGDISAVPAIGSAIEIYWPSYRKWYLAYITNHGSDGTCHLRYDEDNSEQWVTLDTERWRMRSSRNAAAAKSKRSSDQASKRRKSAPVETVAPSITPEDLDAIKIDMFAKLEDFREAMKEQTAAHLERVDRAIIRNDVLSRILVQIGDLQRSYENDMQSMKAGFAQMEKRVNQCMERLARIDSLERRSPTSQPQPQHAKQEEQVQQDQQTGEGIKDVERPSVDVDTQKAKPITDDKDDPIDIGSGKMMAKSTPEVTSKPQEIEPAAKVASPSVEDVEEVRVGESERAEVTHDGKNIISIDSDSDSEGGNQSDVEMKDVTEKEEKQTPSTGGKGPTANPTDLEAKELEEGKQKEKETVVSMDDAKEDPGVVEKKDVQNETVSASKPSEEKVDKSEGEGEKGEKAEKTRQDASDESDNSDASDESDSEDEKTAQTPKKPDGVVGEGDVASAGEENTAKGHITSGVDDEKVVPDEATAAESKGTDPSEGEKDTTADTSPKDVEIAEADNSTRKVATVPEREADGGKKEKAEQVEDGANSSTVRDGNP